MPQDKLTEQWSQDDSRIANDATSAQGDTYMKQGRPNSQPGRQHADFSYQPNIGGNDYIKPTATSSQRLQITLAGSTLTLPIFRTT